MDSLRDRQSTCGFCDGTGLWPDPGSDPDPCPLCDGSGVPPEATHEESQAVEALTRLLTILPRLGQAERQRLYEELHGRYDCRIYR